MMFREKQLLRNLNDLSALISENKISIPKISVLNILNDCILVIDKLITEKEARENEIKALKANQPVLCGECKRKSYCEIHKEWLGDFSYCSCGEREGENNEND